MFEKTPTMLLVRLGLAIITAIAIRTSITAYSTVVTPFCRLRFASEIESVVFSIVSLDSTSLYFLRCVGFSGAAATASLTVPMVLGRSQAQREWQDGAGGEVRVNFFSF